MTATDELRRLLDERGVEWRDDSSIYGTRRTVWTADGVTYVAAEVSGRLKVSGYLTPEQAVEATLGSDLEAENAKLREELAKWERLTAGINLPDYPISQFVPKDLERENAKLRELVRKVEHYEQFGCHDCPHGGSCAVDTLYDEGCAMSREIEREKRELGIEVDA